MGVLTLYINTLLLDFANVNFGLVHDVNRKIRAESSFAAGNVAEYSQK